MIINDVTNSESRFIFNGRFVFKDEAVVESVKKMMHTYNFFWYKFLNVR